MTDIRFNDNNTLVITPAATSSHHDFDFFVGHWHIHNRRLTSRLDHCTAWEEFDASQETHLLLQGFGIIDKFVTTPGGKPFEGMTLRLFDPGTRLWSIYWADSTCSKLDIPVVGSFNHHIGNFIRKDVYKGRDIIIRYHWDKTNPDKPVWSQAYSPDKGQTWEWNWYMYMSRL